MYLLLFFFFFFSSRRRHTRCGRDWSSDVCSSDLMNTAIFTGSPSCTMVAISAMFIWKPPSPEMAHTVPLGRARCTPIAAGTANPIAPRPPDVMCERSEEHTSELQSRPHLVCRLLLEKKKTH